MRGLLVIGLLLMCAGLVGFAFFDVALEQSRLSVQPDPVWEGREVTAMDAPLMLAVVLGSALVMLDGVRFAGRPSDGDLRA
jgi:lysylphosphatidylglycerol synthetase-like protein (DUF2156 family)